MNIVCSGCIFFICCCHVRMAHVPVYSDKHIGHFTVILPRTWTSLKCLLTESACVYLFLHIRHSYSPDSNWIHRGSTWTVEPKNQKEPSKRPFFKKSENAGRTSENKWWKIYCFNKTHFIPLKFRSVQIWKMQANHSWTSCVLDVFLRHVLGMFLKHYILYIQFHILDISHL